MWSVLLWRYCLLRSGFLAVCCIVCSVLWWLHCGVLVRCVCRSRWRPQMLDRARRAERGSNWAFYGETPWRHLFRLAVHAQLHMCLQTVCARWH